MTTWAKTNQITENGMLIGILGIGIIELIILGLLAGVIVGVVVYIISGSGKGDE